MKTLNALKLEISFKSLPEKTITILKLAGQYDLAKEGYVYIAPSHWFKIRCKSTITDADRARKFGATGVNPDNIERWIDTCLLDAQNFSFKSWSPSYNGYHSVKDNLEKSTEWLIRKLSDFDKWLIEGCYEIAN